MRNSRDLIRKPENEFETWPVWERGRFVSRPNFASNVYHFTCRWIWVVELYRDRLMALRNARRDTWLDKNRLYHRRWERSFGFLKIESLVITLSLVRLFFILHLRSSLFPRQIHISLFAHERTDGSGK